MGRERVERIACDTGGDKSCATSRLRFGLLPMGLVSVRQGHPGPTVPFEHVTETRPSLVPRSPDVRTEWQSLHRWAGGVKENEGKGGLRVEARALTCASRSRSGVAITVQHRGDHCEASGNGCQELQAAVGSECSRRWPHFPFIDVPTRRLNNTDCYNRQQPKTHRLAPAVPSGGGGIHLLIRLKPSRRAQACDDGYLV